MPLQIVTGKLGNAPVVWCLVSYSKNHAAKLDRKAGTFRTLDLSVKDRDFVTA